MKIKTDANGRIVARIFPSIGTDALYDADGYTTAPDDQLATHYKDGVLLTAPVAPGQDYTFNEGTFAWVYDTDKAWALVRKQRDAMIAQTDWTQLPDVPLATKEAWATYRQALRDITTQTDPANITWPTPPASN